MYFGSRGFQFWRRSFKIASISSMDLRSPAIPMMLSFRSFTSISIKSPSSTSAIGPPSTASGLQWPMTGPVEAPEKRPSVISAMSPVPTLIVFIGGAVASESCAIASSDIYGHAEISIAPCATFMENAIQVGHPHSLQFFFGVILKI